MRPYSAGATLTEYLFIGCIIAVLAVPVFLSLGGGLNKFLGALSDNARSNINASKSAKQAVLMARSGNGVGVFTRAPYNGPTVNGNRVIPPPRPGEIQYCTQGGFCVNVPPLRNTGTVQTSGGNGTTTYSSTYVAALLQIAAQLEAIDPSDSLAALIRRTALAGHNVANQEARIISTSESTSWGDNARDRMQADGRELLARQDQFNAVYDTLQTALTRDPGALPDPLKAIIAEGGQTVNDTATHVGEKAASENRVFSDEPAVTEAASNGICGTGGGSCTQYVYQGAPPSEATVPAETAVTEPAPAADPAI